MNVWDYFFHLRSRYVPVLPAHLRMLNHSPSSPPPTLGYLQPMSLDEDDVYPSCTLLILGFFFIFPWMLGAFFLGSPNPTARTAGMLSTVLAVVTVTIYLLLFSW